MRTKRVWGSEWVPERVPMLVLQSVPTSVVFRVSLLLDEGLSKYNSDNSVNNQRTVYAERDPVGWSFVRSLLFVPPSVPVKQWTRVLTVRQYR